MSLHLRAALIIFNLFAAIVSIAPVISQHVKYGETTLAACIHAVIAAITLAVALALLVSTPRGEK